MLRHTVAALTIAAAFLVGGCGAKDSDRLVGNWEPTEVPSVDLAPSFDRSTAEINFDTDGGWTASDGCNDLTGNYTLDDDGNFTVEAGSVGVGCSGGQIPYDFLLAQTDHVAFKSDGSAEFESSDDDLLLALSPAP
jgi:hypothetical protein